MDRARAVAWLVTGALLAGCGPNRKPLRIGSKSFTEQVILGEIIAQHVENRLGQPVDRKLDLGGTLLAHQALIVGEIDLYPEYTGTALTAILKIPPALDPLIVLERVRMEYRRRWQVEWLDPLGFSNDFALVIRGEDARANGLESLSDAESYQAGWVLGVGHEFLTRPDGYPALMRKYRLRLIAAPKTMDPGHLYQALQKKQVNMAAGNSTDGPLSALDVKVLKDDRGAFPPCEAAIAVRAESLEAHPGLRQALNELSSKFSEDLMRRLNYQVDGRRMAVREVARQFLRQAGLLTAAQSGDASPAEHR